jgi:Holliday junction resolvase RusA-like endonuclease
VREKRVGDVDNFCGKPLLDWLKGVLFDDDKQVAELHMIRHDDPTRAPGLYVWVWPADVPKLAA